MQNHNSSMRVKLSGYSDVAKLIIETEDVSELSQSELTDKYSEAPSCEFPLFCQTCVEEIVQRIHI